jgi:hypothetical protein
MLGAALPDAGAIAGGMLERPSNNIGVWHCRQRIWTTRSPSFSSLTAYDSAHCGQVTRITQRVYHDNRLRSTPKRHPNAPSRIAACA